MTIYIYILKHPKTQEVRYVGKTINVKSRLSNHIINARSGLYKRYVCGWIRSLLAKGLKPEIEVIEECNEANWEARESYWISEYRKTAKLCNHTDGGKGSRITTKSNKRSEELLAIRQKNLPEKYSIAERKVIWELIRDANSLKEAQAFVPLIRRNTYYECKSGKIWNDITGLSKPEINKGLRVKDKHPSAKITMQIANDIRKLYVKGETPMRIFADYYGISIKQVQKIISGGNW